MAGFDGKKCFYCTCSVEKGENLGGISFKKWDHFLHESELLLSQSSWVIVVIRPHCVHVLLCLCLVSWPSVLDAVGWATGRPSGL